MGGRGQESRASGMPKNKKKAINSLNKNIKEHKQKISEALRTGKNQTSIHHWEAEIKAFEDKVKQIERRYKK